MALDDRDVFGEYVPGPRTTATPVAADASPPDQIDSTKYGIGKPRRIVVRGTVAADSGIEDTRK